MKKLPLFYFSPTICWIDDNQIFLDAAYNLFKNDYNCLTFTEPREAIRFIKKYQSPIAEINFTREFTESDIFDTHNHLPVDINISEITKLANCQKIKNEMAVLIIDNSMPHMNGLEICYQLKGSAYKKILLTGTTEPKDVIDAFNQGIIDKFIAKEKNFADKLQNMIFELSYDYFYERTNNLISHLEASRLSPLSDSVFVEFFLQMNKSNKIQEFYLLNRHGSFLCKNKKGECTYFIMMSESAKNEFIKFNKEVPEKIKNYICQVANGTHIPFFGVEKESWEFNYDSWDNYFYPANLLKGRENYYWTIIK